MRILLIGVEWGANKKTFNEGYYKRQCHFWHAYVEEFVGTTKMLFFQNIKIGITVSV